MPDEPETLEDYIKNNPCTGPFRPSAFYQEEGDILQIFLRPDQDYSQPLGGGIDVHLSQEDDSITGVTLWGVKRLLREGGMVAERLVDGTEIEPRTSERR